MISLTGNPKERLGAALSLIGLHQHFARVVAPSARVIGTRMTLPPYDRIPIRANDGFEGQIRLLIR